MNIEPRTPDNPEGKYAYISIVNNPLDPRDVSHYQTEFGAESRLLTDILPDDLGDMVVSINGEIVAPEKFGSTHLSADNYLIIVPVLRGGKSGLKSALSIVALIAISVVSYGVGTGAAAGALGAGTLAAGSTGALAAAAAIQVVGGILVTSLLSPKPMQDSGSDTFDSSTYGVDGAKSTSLDGVPVPIVYGETRIGPNRVGVYTDQQVSNGTVSSSQDLYLLYALSEGEIEGVDTSTIEIDEQPISIYTSDEISVGKILTGTTDQAAPDYFSDQTITPVNAQIELDYNNAVTRQTAGPVDLFRIDLMAPSLIRYGAGGDAEEVLVQFDVRYRPVGSTGAYTNLYVTPYPNGHGVGIIIGGTTYTDALPAGYTMFYSHGQAVTQKVTLVNNQYVLNGVDYTVTSQTNVRNVPLSGLGDLVVPTYQTFCVDSSNTKTGSGTTYISALKLLGGKWLVITGKGAGGAAIWTAYPFIGFVAGVTIYSQDPCIRGTSTSAVRTEFVTPTLPNAQYEFIITRKTPLYGGSAIETVYLTDVNDIVTGGCAYRRTAMMSFKITLTGNLSDVPNVTVVVKGRKIQVRRRDDPVHPEIAAGQYFWTTSSVNEDDTRATLLSQSTGNEVDAYYSYSNPAWVAWNMLTDPDVGAGFDTSRLDIEKWQEWADFCESEGLRFNAVFQADSNLWDSLQYVLRAGHAQLISVGTRYTVAIERVDDPVMIFNVTNIVKDSLQIDWLPKTQLVNEVQCTYYDKTNDYKQDTVIVRNPNSPASDRQRTHTLSAYWVTDVATAYKEAAFELNMNELITHTVTFQAPIEAISCSLGDQFILQHDAPIWDIGGRTESGSSTNLIKLDRPVAMAENELYEILLQLDVDQRYTGTVASVSFSNQANDLVMLNGFDGVQSVNRISIAGTEYGVLEIMQQTGDTVAWGVKLDNPVAAGAAAVGATYILYKTDAIITCPVVTFPGTSEQVTLVNPLGAAPAQNVKWLFGKVNLQRKTYRVKSLEYGSSYTRTIIGIEYNANMYLFDGSVQQPNFEPPAPLGQVTGLQAEQFMDLTGTVYSPRIGVSWDAPADGIYGGANVYASFNGSLPKLIGSPRGGALGWSFSAAALDSVIITVVAVDGTGKEVSFSGAPTFGIIIKGDLIAPAKPTNLAVTPVVKGLQLSFIEPTDADLKAIRIYRSLADDFTSATYLTSIAGASYVDHPGDFQTYFYWVTAADYSGNESEPNDTAGTSGRALQVTTDDIGDGAVGSGQLSDDVNDRIDLIDAPTTGLVDAVNSIKTGQAAGTDALGNLITGSDLLNTTVNAQGLRLASVETTVQQVTDDVSATADQVTTLIARVDNAVSAAQDEITARVDADEAMATDIVTLYAAKDANASAIQQESIVRTNADTALAQQINTLTSQSDANVAAIESEATARTDADSALADEIDTLSSQVGTNSAAISTEQTARANADSALANQISTVQATVNGHTTSIQTQATAIANLSAEYTVKIDLNGYIVGYGLAATLNDGTPTSEFYVRADKFSIGAPGATQTYPFVVQDGIVTIDKEIVTELDGTLINAGVLKATTIYTGSNMASEAYPTNTFYPVSFGHFSFNGDTANNVQTGTDIRFYAPGALGGDTTHRVRGGDMTFVVSISAVVNEWLSIWYRINGGTWVFVVKTDEPQSGYGSVGISYAAAVHLGPTDFIDFGFGVMDETGAIRDAKNNLLWATASVMGFNFT